MSFWEKFVRKSAGDTNTATATTPVHETQWQASPRPSATPSDTAGLYATEYAVRTVTDFIASNIASLPFKAYVQQANGDRAEIAVSTPLASMLAHPSGITGQTRFTLFKALLLDQLLTGSMCATVTHTATGYGLRRILPSNYSIRVNGNEEPTALDVTIDGHSSTLRLPNAAVLLSHGYNPDTASVPTALRDLLDEARALSEYRRQIARNGGRVSAYVYRPKEMPWLSQDDYDDFKMALDNYTKGGGREGGWPILKDGMEFRTIDAFKPVDVNDLEARDRINIAVCNAYHVSPENLGFRTGTNSNIQAFKEQLWAVELMPYIVQFEQALNMTLPAITGQPDAWIEANVDAKLRGTFSEQYQALSTATGRPFMTTNEARRLLNRPQVPEGDQLITPLNVSEGRQPSPQDGGRTQQAQEGTIR